jgi:hypothetical protein
MGLGEFRRLLSGAATAVYTTIREGIIKNVLPATIEPGVLDIV